MKKKMTLLFSAMAAIAVAATACDNSKEEWNGGKDDGNSSDDGNHEQVVPAKEKWAAMADSCTYVLVENFLDKTQGTFWGTPRDIEKNSDYLYWQQAHAIGVVVDSYERIKATNQSLAKTYEGYFERWYQNYAHNYNTSHKGDGSYGGFFNQWTDDMAWICLTLLRMTEATGVEKYALTAKDVYDNYIWPRATKDDKGTGLPWTDRTEDQNNKNACTNSPSCLVAAKLYIKFKKESYLSNAKTLYDYSVATMPDDQRVEEPPLTYTQGTFGEACRQLYHITGDQTYIKKAARVIEYAFVGNRCTDSKTGVLRHEGTDMDQSIFKAVLIPYAVNLVLDEKADKTSRLAVKEKLLLCAETLDKHLDRNLYPQMYCNYFWGENFTSGVASMGAQASGASLMEGVARMVAAEE